MSNYDIAKLKELLNEKWGKKNCPMCGENNWNIQLIEKGKLILVME